MQCINIDLFSAYDVSTLYLFMFDCRSEYITAIKNL